MRKLVLSMLTLSFAALLMVGTGFAADEDKAEKAFKKMDANSDGKVTLEEVKAGKEGDKAAKAEKAFTRLDKNSDGSLSLEEFKAAGKKKEAN